MFTGEEEPPYVHALCYEAPIQLYQMKKMCDAKGIDLDTTGMHGQQSELLNKVMKELIHTMSSLEHVTGEEKVLALHTNRCCSRTGKAR